MHTWFHSSWTEYTRAAWDLARQRHSMEEGRCKIPPPAEELLPFDNHCEKENQLPLMVWHPTGWPYGGWGFSPMTSWATLGVTGKTEEKKWSSHLQIRWEGMRAARMATRRGIENMLKVHDRKFPTARSTLLWKVMLISYMHFSYFKNYFLIRITIFQYDICSFSSCKFMRKMLMFDCYFNL